MIESKQKKLPGVWSPRYHCLLIMSFFMVLFLNSMSSYAEDKNVSFNQQIAELKKAEKVSVILSQASHGAGSDKYQARYWLTRLDGCHHYVTDPSKIRYLIANSKQLNIQSISQEKSFLPSVGISIQFDFANNKKIQMLMGNVYPNESVVDGEVYVNAQLTPQTFVINQMVHRDIRRWLAKHGRISEAKSCARDCGHLSYYCRLEVEKDFFRSNLHQTCKTEDFHRPTRDYCESGWQPSYLVKQGE